MKNNLIEKKVAIIITSYNQNQILDKCLDSLKKKTNYKNYRVFLVDDSGRGNIAKEAQRKHKWITAIANNTNIGFAKSNNIGMKKAIGEYDPDYLLMLNDDTEFIQKNWLIKMIKVAESDKNIGILGCRVIYPDGSLQWFAKNGKITFYEKPGNKQSISGIDRIQTIDNVLGAFFLIKGKVIKKIGLLDEGFSPFYGEETDFCYRAKNMGFRCAYVGDVTTIHYRNKSISTLTENEVWYIKKKNSIRLELRHYGFLKNIKLLIIHFASVFLKKQNNQINFQRDMVKKLGFLIKAYYSNFKNEPSNKRFNNGL